MALFKIFKGKTYELEQVKIVDGHAYFCTDDGSFWIDYAKTEENGSISYHRKRVEGTPPDWNIDDPNIPGFIKNKPDIESINNEISSLKTKVVETEEAINELQANGITEAQVQSLIEGMLPTIKEEY